MLNAALGFSCVLVAVLLALYLPLPLTASTAAGGILWWLFSSYRDVLEGRKMSGSGVNLNLSRSGLLDGYSPRVYPSGDGEAVYSPKGDRRFNRPLFDRSGDFFRSPPAWETERNSIFSPSGRPSESSGRLNQSSGRLNDSSGFLGSPVSPRCPFRVSVNAQNETPVTSPSVSIMSRSWSKDNPPYSSDRVTSPGLPPGSYPWLMPHDGSSSKEKIAIPVKIKISKPTSNFVVPAPEVPNNEEPPKADASKQIIQALKAMSRKRMHTTESDESVDDSAGTNLPKRRPGMEFYHNLYASHLGGSAESSLAHSLPELPEDSLTELRAANGVENQPASPAHLLIPSSQHHSNSIPQQQLLPINAITLSNKRPRSANDSGNQTAKKRNNNEIICSLSSSLAILDPKLLQRSLKRKDVDKDVMLKRQKLKETTCAEVQTLPCPILKDDQPKGKEDKGTATDRVSDDSPHDRSRNRPVVPEKKVTGNMATALLKSAMIKFASSGELVTPDTSLTSNSGCGDTPSSKDSGPVSVATAEAPKAAGFNFGATPTTTSSDKTDGSQARSLFSFGGKPASADATATSTTTATVVTSSVTTLSSAQPSTQPSGFTLAGFPKPPTSNGLFKFGSDAAAKEDTSKNEPKQTESSPVSKPNFTFGASKPGGFSFGATTSAATVPVASVAPSTVASTPSGFTLGQSNQPVSTSASMFGQSSQPASTASNMFGQSSAPATTAAATIVFGQTQPASTAASTKAQAEATITFGQPSKPPTAGGFGQSSLTFGSSFGQTTQPTAGGFSLSSTAPATTVTTQSATSNMAGGFSFTPSVSFSMGSSPTSSTSSTSLAPIFSFGSSGAGQKQDSAKSLFGMPPRPATSAPSSTASEPPKSFGGFNFTPSAAKEPGKPLFPSATPQNPEQKKVEGFQFGQNPAAPSKAFSFGSNAGSAGPSKGSTTFSFSNNGAIPAPAPAQGPATGTSLFNPTGTGPSLFGSTTTPASGFGPTTPKTSSGFGTPTTTAPSFGTPSGGFGTTPSFGSTAATQPSAFGTPSSGQTPAFGAAATQSSTFGTGSTQGAFGSTAPAGGFGAPTTTAASGFGSSAPAFGASSAPAFGSTSSAFGSTTPAFGASTGFSSGSTAFGTTQSTFGSVASTSGSTSTPAFGSSPATTTTTQFSSGGFGASAFGSSTAAPAFGSSTAAPAFGSSTAAPAFGAGSSSTQAAAPAFGATQTTSAPTAFNFSAPSSGGFNFASPQSSGSSMFQFTTSAAPAPQPGGQQPFTFSGAPSPAPGGFQNTMFSIGSGSSAPRSRTALRTRKK